MKYEGLLQFIAPLALIITGLFLRSLKGISPSYEEIYKKYWMSFILIGGFLLLSRLYI